MFTSRLTILTYKRVLSLSTQYIKVCYFYSKPKRYQKKKKTQGSVERVMDGNSIYETCNSNDYDDGICCALGIS